MRKLLALLLIFIFTVSGCGLSKLKRTDEYDMKEEQSRGIVSSERQHETTTTDEQPEETVYEPEKYLTTEISPFFEEETNRPFFESDYNAFDDNIESQLRKLYGESKSTETIDFIRHNPEDIQKFGPVRIKNAIDIRKLLAEITKELADEGENYKLPRFSHYSYSVDKSASGNTVQQVKLYFYSYFKQRSREFVVSLYDHMMNIELPSSFDFESDLVKKANYINLGDTNEIENGISDDRITQINEKMEVYLKNAKLATSGLTDLTIEKAQAIKSIVIDEDIRLSFVQDSTSGSSLYVMGDDPVVSLFAVHYDENGMSVWVAKERTKDSIKIANLLYPEMKISDKSISWLGKNFQVSDSFDHNIYVCNEVTEKIFTEFSQITIF